MEKADNNKEKLSGMLILIVGPSGSGKGTVINILKEKYPKFFYPVSYSTRTPRGNEKDGVVYHFVAKTEFEKMIRKGDFLEYAIVHSNNYYGTSKKEIMDALKASKVVIREVDIQGFHSIQKIISRKNLVSIFMRVSSEADLRQRILRRSNLSDEELNRRMESARKELAQSSDCDYQVENKWGEIDVCVKNVEKIILESVKDL